MEQNVLMEVINWELCTIDELINAVQGTCVHVSGDPCPIHSVAIDSRKVKPSSLFIPLKGEQTDGHLYLKQAITRGAGTLLVSDLFWHEQKQRFREELKTEKVTVIAVPDTLKALQDFSKIHLQKFPSLYKIGITGSNGKTTTKEIMGSLLREAGNTIINEGNFNSEIGLPLSVLRVQEHHHYGVFEMGMNHEGEMDILVTIVKPDAALITNIGNAHIGLLGSKDAIAREKKKICDYFTGEQILLLNEKEPYYSFLSKGVKGKIIPYGQKSTKGFTGYEDLGLDGMTINWEGFQIHYPLFGEHNLYNALGAISLARELGLASSSIVKGLEHVEPLFGRSQIYKGGVTIIMDCYNSNPDSARKVLSFVHSVQWKGRKVVVLGSMLELGEESEKSHTETAAYALSLSPGLLILYGKEFEGVYHTLQEQSVNTHLFWADTMDSLTKLVKEQVKDGDLVLLKGSRGVALEQLPPKLQNGYM